MTPDRARPGPPGPADLELARLALRPRLPMSRSLRTLLPLYCDPRAEPAPWAMVHRFGGGLTVVVDLHDGQQPANMPRVDPEPARLAATGRLAEAGIHLLGRVDLGYAVRPLTDLTAEVTAWSAYRVRGIFFDRAPAEPAEIGAVALAVRVARRHGLTDLVLNPGRPVDPLFRRLGAAICSFEGAWAEYRRRPETDAAAGDGHLVYGVPPAEQNVARRLLSRRGAAFGLVTDRTPPHPYAGLPAWFTMGR